MAAKRTLTNTQAARILGINPRLLRWRASVGKIKVAKRSPLMFRVVDVMEAQERMRAKDPRGSWKRPTAEAKLTAALLS